MPIISYRAFFRRRLDRMFNRILSILLASTIATCPLLCKWKVARGADAGSCCCCCQAHGGQERGSDHRSPSDQPSRSPAKPCQCICGGAVIQPVSLPHFGPEISWPIAIPPLHSAALFADASRCNSFMAPPPPGGSMNPGRALRCLFATFLC